MLPFCAAAQTVEVRIEQADEIARNPAVVDGQRLIGDVKLAVDGAVVYCDSAWRYTDGRFQMMGEVRMEDGPMALVWTPVDLHPDSGVGTMTGPQVRLVDRSEAVESGHWSRRRTTMISGRVWPGMQAGERSRPKEN